MALKHLLKYSDNAVEGFTKLAKSSPVFGVPYKIAAQKLIDLKFPINFNIESTNACNLNCSMCPRNESKRKVGFMDFGLFKKIVDESSEYGSRIFSLHKDGEPLMHPKINDMIAYIKEKNPDNCLYLTTNGQLLDERKSKAILENGVDKLNISIGAANPETYEKVKGVKNLEKVNQNVLRFLEMKKAGDYKKPIVSVQIIRMKETMDEIPDFARKWKKEDVVVSVWGFINWGGKKSDPNVRFRKKRHPCYALWTAPVINWNGKVSICCVDWNEENIIGDVNKEPFSKVWQGALLKRYRALHLKGEYDKLPLCSKCNIWQDYPDFFFWWQKGRHVK